MKQLVSPSILAADFGNLNPEIDMLNRSEADWVHCDVMDGRFVPNISFGIPVLKAVKKISQKPLDVHLMIVEPEKYLSAFRDAGADILSVHIEASVHMDRLMHAIREKGMRPGIAVNPSTPVDALRDLVNIADVVCLMSVNPGFGGQKFIPRTLKKIRQLRQLIDEERAGTLIEVDGGVTGENAASVLAAGADVLVAGSYVFRSDDPEARISYLKHMDPEMEQA